MSDSSYYYHKLDKIQFAIRYLIRIKNGADVEALLDSLQDAESKAAEDLIEAEQAEAL